MLEIDHVCSIEIGEKIDRLILMRNEFGYFNHARHAIHFNYARCWWPHEHVETIHIQCSINIWSCVRVSVRVVDAGATWNGNFRRIFITKKIEYFMYLVDAFGCRNNHYVHHEAFSVRWMASLPHVEFEFLEWWTRKSSYARVCHFDDLTLRSTHAFIFCVFISDTQRVEERRMVNDPPKQALYSSNANWRACVNQ